jgi:hypothetical protein
MGIVFSGTMSAPSNVAPSVSPSPPKPAGRTAVKNHTPGALRIKVGGGTRFASPTFATGARRDESNRSARFAPSAVRSSTIATVGLVPSA